MKRRAGQVTAEERGTRGTENCRWLTALVTPGERDEIASWARSRGLGVSGAVRGVAEMIARGGLPCDLSTAIELRLALDDAGGALNLSARCLNRAALRFSTFPRFSTRDANALLDLARAARDRAGEARERASALPGIASRVAAAGTVIVEDAGRDGTRTSSVRARVSPSLSLAVAGAAASRGESASATLRLALLAACRAHGGRPVLLTGREAALLRSSWVRWRCNAAQASGSASRLRARLVGTGVLPAGRERALGSAVSEAVAAATEATRIAAGAFVLLASAGLGTGA